MSHQPDDRASRRPVLIRCLSLLGALVLDMAFGEPPDSWHPVAWIGRLAARLEALAPSGGTWPRLAFGAALTAVLTAGSGLVAWTIERRLRSWPLAVQVVLGALALKPVLSMRALIEAAATVGQNLDDEELDQARQTLRSLVSRPTGALTAPQIVSASIESLSENLPDSLLAPVIYYVVGGLPAAYAYRTANTLDAMIGYRNSRYEHLGKTAARLDDLLNLVPARLGTLALILAAGRGTASRALATAWREHTRTASPNAGWPMSAAAGALGVHLEKPEHYQLGDDFPAPQTVDLLRGIHLVQRAAPIGIGLIIAATALANLRTSSPRTPQPPSRAGKGVGGLGPAAARSTH